MSVPLRRRACTTPRVRCLLGRDSSPSTTRVAPINFETTSAVRPSLPNAACANPTSRGRKHGSADHDREDGEARPKLGQFAHALIERRVARPPVAAGQEDVEERAKAWRTARPRGFTLRSNQRSVVAKFKSIRCERIGVAARPKLDHLVAAMAHQPHRQGGTRIGSD